MAPSIPSAVKHNMIMIFFCRVVNSIVFWVFFGFQYMRGRFIVCVGVGGCNRVVVMKQVGVRLDYLVFVLHKYSLISVDEYITRVWKKENLFQL